MTVQEQRHDLVLHIKVPGIWVDDWAEEIANPDSVFFDDLGCIIDEHLDSSVGLSILPNPMGEEGWEIRTYNCNIVGGELVGRRHVG